MEGHIVGTEVERPNLLWIVSEDCPPWFGCYGDTLAATPAIDALAKNGVLYERAYSPAPVCSPSRFGLLTGISPERHSPADRMRAIASRPAWMTTYPEELRAAGYYCTNNAKTDYNMDVDADAIWDDSSRTAHWRNRPSDSPFLAVFNYDSTHESSIFDENSGFAKAMAPFAAFLTNRKPLKPAVPLDDIRLPGYLPDTSEVRGDFARYYTAVARLDAFVAELLDALAADGLADDTVVILTSDHGGVTPRSKRYVYEEGVHVPLIVSAPTRWAHRFQRPGSRRAEPVSTLTIPATLLDLAGVPAPAQLSEQSLAADGRVDAPTLAFSGRERMDERISLVRSVRSRRFRYLRNYTPHRPVIQHQAFAWNAAGYRSWEHEHLAGTLAPEQERWWQAADVVELYEIDSDPDELVNLAGRPEFVEIERDLRTALRDHILEVNDNGFLPEDSDRLGIDASRQPGAYPLERILELADQGIERSPDRLDSFVEALADPDSTIRRWAAIGILGLSPQISDDAVEALRSTLTDPAPWVVVPAAEGLARAAADEAAYSALAAIACDADAPWTRLEAINALTYLDVDRVRPYRAAVDAAAESAEEYLGNAGRYLRLVLNGEYTPEAEVFQPTSLGASLVR